jgi:transcription elongation factor Elf1
MTIFLIALVFVPDAHIELFTMFYCPNCKSQEIFPVAGGCVGQVYLCKYCGYRGSFVLEIDGADAFHESEKENKDHPK